MHSSRCVIRNSGSAYGIMISAAAACSRNSANLKRFSSAFSDNPERLSAMALSITGTPSTHMIKSSSSVRLIFFMSPPYGKNPARCTRSPNRQTYNVGCKRTGFSPVFMAINELIFGEWYTAKIQNCLRKSLRVVT